MAGAIFSRVLLVDDDELVERAFRRALASNVVLTTARNRATAIEAIRATPPDLAIVDLQLGRESGIDVVRDIKGESSHTRIVVISGYGSVDATVWAMRAGADDVIEKPTTFAEIVRRCDATEPSEFEPVSLERAQWEHVRRVLNACGGNVSLTARRLGVYRTTLRRWLHKPAPKM
jgi:two-component system response regulator RegA